jgi:hypothetical protein
VALDPYTLCFDNVGHNGGDPIHISATRLCVVTINGVQHVQRTECKSPNVVTPRHCGTDGVAYLDVYLTCTCQVD